MQTMADTLVKFHNEVWGSFILAAPQNKTPHECFDEGLYLWESGYSGGAVKMASFDAGKPGCDSGMVSRPSIRCTLPFSSK